MKNTFVKSHILTHLQYIHIVQLWDLLGDINGFMRGDGGCSSPCIWSMLLGVLFRITEAAPA